MKFAAERRPSLKTEQPELTFGEVRLVAQPHAPTRLPSEPPSRVPFYCAHRLAGPLAPRIAPCRMPRRRSTSKRAREAMHALDSFLQRKAFSLLSCLVTALPLSTRQFRALNRSTAHTHTILSENPAHPTHSSQIHTRHHYLSINTSSGAVLHTCACTCSASLLSVPKRPARAAARVAHGAGRRPRSAGTPSTAASPGSSTWAD